MRRYPHLSLPFGIVLATVVGAGTANADEWRSGLEGGSGGAPFSITAPSPLVGVHLYQGDVLNSLQGYYLAGGLRSETPTYGNTAAPQRSAFCNPGDVMVGAELQTRSVFDKFFVGDVAPRCAASDGTGIPYSARTGWISPDAGGLDLPFGDFTGTPVTGLACPPQFVVTGFHGRAGDWTDAIGIVCRPAADFSAPPPAPPPPDDDRMTEGQCAAYARDAVDAQNTNLSLDCGLTGPRYSADYDGHFRWCLEVDRAAVRAEEDARNTEIRSCLLP